MYKDIYLCTGVRYKKTSLKKWEISTTSKQCQNNINETTWKQHIVCRSKYKIKFVYFIYQEKRSNTIQKSLFPFKYKE